MEGLILAPGFRRKVITGYGPCTEGQLPLNLTVPSLQQRVHVWTPPLAC